MRGGPTGQQSSVDGQCTQYMLKGWHGRSAWKKHRHIWISKPCKTWLFQSSKSFAYLVFLCIASSRPGVLSVELKDGFVPDFGMLEDAVVSTVGTLHIIAIGTFRQRHAAQVTRPPIHIWKCLHVGRVPTLTRRPLLSHFRAQSKVGLQKNGGRISLTVPQNQHTIQKT